jgi:hypothetical protein
MHGAVRTAHPVRPHARIADMLTLAIRLAAIIPIVAGGAGALSGAGFLHEVAGPATASHLRYLSGVLLGLGLVALWCASDLAARGGIFRALCAVVVLGGLARLVGLAIGPVPPWPHVAALLMELGVVPALWAAARRAQPGAAHGS